MPGSIPPYTEECGCADKGGNLVTSLPELQAACDRYLQFTQSPEDHSYSILVVHFMSVKPGNTKKQLQHFPPMNVFKNKTSQWLPW